MGGAGRGMGTRAWSERYVCIVKPVQLKVGGFFFFFFFDQTKLLYCWKQTTKMTLENLETARKGFLPGSKMCKSCYGTVSEAVAVEMNLPRHKHSPRLLLLQLTARRQNRHSPFATAFQRQLEMLKWKSVNGNPATLFEMTATTQQVFHICADVLAAVSLQSMKKIKKNIYVVEFCFRANC